MPGGGTMLRNMATIFLFNGDLLLMMKRPADKELNPGVWSVIGKHMQPFVISVSLNIKKYQGRHAYGFG